MNARATDFEGHLLRYEKAIDGVFETPQINNLILVALLREELIKYVRDLERLVKGE